MISIIDQAGIGLLVFVATLRKLRARDIWLRPDVIIWVIALNMKAWRQAKSPWVCMNVYNSGTICFVNYENSPVRDIVEVKGSQWSPPINDSMPIIKFKSR